MIKIIECCVEVSMRQCSLERYSSSNVLVTGFVDAILGVGGRTFWHGYLFCAVVSRSDFKVFSRLDSEFGMDILDRT